MTEQWIHQSESILKTIKNLTTKKERDRLEIITNIIFALNASDASIDGWRTWIQNLGFMSRFTKDELQDIEEGLLKLTQAYVEYDIEITKRYTKKIPKKRFTIAPPKKPDNSRGIIA